MINVVASLILCIVNITRSLDEHGDPVFTVLGVVINQVVLSSVPCALLILIGIPYYLTVVCRKNVRPGKIVMQVCEGRLTCLLAIVRHVTSMPATYDTSFGQF